MDSFDLAMTQEKLEKLKSIFESYGSVLVAFSGGVDSTFVLKVARDVLGKKRVKAGTAKSASLPRRELEESSQLASLVDVEHLVIETRELEKPGYAENSPDRCYFCKETLYETLQPIAEREGFKVICNGTNLDDLGDYRPGLRAARDFSVRSPLVEAGFTKADVRYFSRVLGLPTWEKPAMPCLSSRIPYGQEVTPGKLSQIEQAENFLRDLGLRTVRVRHHGDVARIEVAREEMEQFFDERFQEQVAAALKSFGFHYIALDLEGYRMGSFNKVANRSSALK